MHLSVRHSSIYNHSGMKYKYGLYFAILAASGLRASTIVDVSSNTSTTLSSGDSLIFQVGSANFAGTAQSFGQSIFPTAICFALMTSPLSGAGAFDATLSSADGSVSVAFDGPLAFTDGVMASSGYAGSVSALNGYLQLSPLLSEALFSAPPELTLSYTGPDINLGLSPYTLRQQLQVSLISGPLSAGALQGGVTLESPDPSLVAGATFDGSTALSQSGGFSFAFPVPEPDSRMLSLGGGALLVGLSWLARRRTRRRDGIARETSSE
jgi:hypothetical protein